MLVRRFRSIPSKQAAANESFTPRILQTLNLIKQSASGLVDSASPTLGFIST